MARKKIILLGLLSLLLILNIFNVYAVVPSAASITSPPTNAGIKGTTNIVATFTEGDGARNVTFWQRASGVTAWTVIGPNGTSVSAAGTVTVNVTFITSNVADAQNYDFNVTICSALNCMTGDSLQVNTSDSNTGIDVDNSAPNALISIDKAREQIQSGAGVEVDCRNSNDPTGIANTTILLTKADDPIVTTTSTDIFTFLD